MMSHETRDQVRFIIGVIGNVISFGLFLSPVPTFVKIWKRKAVEDFSPIPYIATVLNCMLWVFYGMPFVHPNSTLVITINGTGLVLEAIYITIFFIYSPRALRRKVISYLVAEIAFIAVLAAIVLTTSHTYERRSLIVGIFCIIFGTLMYASPLSVMKLVITTRSVKYMPFYLSLAGFLNGVCWTTYAFLPIDINLIIPNGLGAIFGFLQLVLYACYYGSTPKDEDETRKVEMTSV